MSKINTIASPKCTSFAQKSAGAFTVVSTESAVQFIDLCYVIEITSVIISLVIPLLHMGSLHD